MTDIQIQQLIDNARTNGGDLVTWDELKAILEGLKSQVSLTDISVVENQIPRYISSGWTSANYNINEIMLNSGNTTTVKYIYNPNDSLGQEGVFWESIPYNNGVTYSGKGTASKFSGGFQSFDVNGSGRPNVVGTMFGYNHDMSGGRIVTDEAAVGFRVETHYESGGNLMEIHMPEYTSENGVRHRLLSWYPNKSTDGTAGGPRFETDAFELFKWGDQLTTYASIVQNGQISINAAVDTNNFPGLLIGSLLNTINSTTSTVQNWAIEYTSLGTAAYIGHTNKSLGNNSETLGSLRTMDNFWVGQTPGYGGGINDQRTIQLGGYQLIYNLKSNVPALAVYQENAESVAEFANMPDGYALRVFGQGLQLRNGTTAQRPGIRNGTIRYNTDTNKFEGIENGVWVTFNTTPV